MPDAATEFILLCDGCAEEAGMNDDAHAFPPGADHDNVACQRCGAMLVGFAYRVPASVYTGMAPGAG